MKEFQKFQPAVLICLFLFVGMSFQLFAQSQFKGKALSKNVNTEYDELVPRLSPNGQRMYFARLQHPSNVGGRNSGQDIWFSDRNPDGTWNPAQNAGPQLNNKHHNSVGGISTDGKTLFLANTYAEDIQDVRPGISFTKMLDAGWEMPKTIFGPSVVSEQGQYLDFFVTPDQKIMLIAMTKIGTSKQDLYVSMLLEEGLYSLPKSLGDIINFPNSSETTPSLSQDTKMLFFTSDVAGGMGGGDIYYAERLDDTWLNWSEPKSLGPEVNTAGFDGHFVIGYDGMFAYFVSGKTPTADGDIYEIELKNLQIFKEKLSDTLRVVATAGKTLPLDLSPYGIVANNVNFVSKRRILGTGSIGLDENETGFQYVSQPNYSGTDLFELEVCDPPQSDDCKKIVILATATSSAAPVVPTYQLVTRPNTSVSLDQELPQWSLSRTIGAYESYSGPKGEILTSTSIDSQKLIYTPALDFEGHDSIPILGPCPDGFSNNCLQAILLVTVEPEPAVAIVEPVIEEPIVEVPVVEEPIVEVPVVEEPVVEIPVVEEPIVEVPVVEEPIVEVPVVEEPVVEIPVVEEPVVEIPVVEEPVVEIPVVEEPVVEIPVIEEPSVAIVEKPNVEAPIVAKELVVSGKVLDDESGLPLGTEIVFYEKANEVGRTMSDPNTGAYRIELPMGKDYTLAIEQEYYFPVTASIDKGKASIKGNVIQDIRLTPIPMEAGQTFVLKDIYFDTDQSVLKPESKAELIRLQDLMRRNPTMEIEVRGHTDSQSDDAHNQILSEARAAAVINYLKYQGVMGYRLGSKGFGETMPIATNATEEGRALNRRVEFFIKKM